MLRLRLSEAGWNDSLNAYCRGNCMFFVKYMNDSQQYTIEIVRNKNLGNITFDGLCEEVSDYGRCMCKGNFRCLCTDLIFIATIHESIKVDILEEIKKFIDKHMG